MSGALLAAAFAGGIGLLILALAALTDGVRLAGGSVLKANLAHWAQTRWRAFETGIAIALLVPSSAATTRAASGFVNSGLVRLSNAIWLSVGVSFGSVVTAWLVVACGLSTSAFPLGLVLVGAGALMRGGLRGRRAALGQALAGFGLLLVGVAVLADAFHRGAPAGLPPAPFGLLGTIAAFGVLGAALSTTLRSASVAVAAAVVAVSAGALQIAEAMAFVAGANLGPIAFALWTLLSGTAQARRVALCHAVFHGLGTLVGLVLLIATLPLHARLVTDLGAPFTLAAYHLAFQGGAALLLWPAAGRLERLARMRFHRVEFEEGGSQHLDRNLLEVPDLAIDAFLGELGELFEKARGLAHLALRDRVVSDLRLQKDAEQLERRAAMLDHTAAQLIAGDVPIELAPVLVELPRAGAGLSKMLAELARFRALARTPEQGLDARTRTRLRQLELAVLHLIEGADAMDPAFDAERCSMETEAALQHLADVRRRMHDACGAGELHPGWADPLCARLDSLERVATHAAEVALGIDRALSPPPAEDPLETESEGAVVRWLRRVA
jgi:Na+/phosphate symporter